MKKYPRIYSLSTLGLRHHQAFDYRFHPFRTDFVGDSGCGKSMIADLLQLILVGSDVFSSPTQSTGPRDPSGMVLPHSGGGSGIGYAFLNLEVAHKQYVVIGIYLEDSSNTVKHFIIQAGYGEDRLYPFSVALSIADVMKGNRIPLPDELDAIIQDMELVRTTPARKTFHYWLHTHGLLPLDLSASDKILRDYASIIRAFSRGKMLTITEPESLKAFLFGQEKAKEMWSKFGKAVQDMRESAQQDEWNVQAIADLEAKGAAIDALFILKNDHENARKAWLTASFNDAHRQTSEALEDLQTVTRGAKDGLIALEAYRKIIRQKLAGSEEAVACLATAYDASYERLRPAEARYTDLQEAKAIVAKIGCGAADLAQAYHRSKTLQNIEQLSAELSQALQAINADTLFETLLIPASTFSTIINDITGSLVQKNAALQDNLHLLRFADINAEGSLGHWAIAQEKELTREVESILMHYIDLPTHTQPTPVKGTRAITSPDRLFANPTIITDGKANGFWLQLNGLEEYISYVDEQLFTEGDLTEIAQRLETLSASSRASADALQAEIARLEQLRVCLQQLSRPQESIEAYNAQSQLENEHSNPHLDFSAERLELYLQALQAERSIAADYSRLKEAMEAAQTQKIVFGEFIGELQTMESRLGGHIEQNSWTDNLRRIEEAVLSIGYYNGQLP